ncbi:MAG: GlsB/YeaQ/YmgE family stress response membrane protein [Candidatus Aureabacteria bacterium]|nr:GlsB/YeaQ/YmgE family stress response membrane protein [Candidatus Auribacterota bacterium]
MDTGLVWFILIGLAAGWLAGQLTKGSGFGLIGDLVVGVIGALVGGFVFGTLGIFVGAGLLGALIVATIGAIILLFLLRLIKKAL